MHNTQTDSQLQNFASELMFNKLIAIHQQSLLQNRLKINYTTTKQCFEKLHTKRSPVNEGLRLSLTPDLNAIESIK